MPNESTTPESMSYEAAMQRAESIAAALTRGTASLDEALPVYEEGIALVAHAAALLDGYRRRAQDLGDGGDSSLGPDDPGA